MKTIKTILAIFIFSMSINLSIAQEMKAKKYENPNWVSMSYVKFKPMKKDAAMEVIDSYFAKADMQAGLEAPTVYHFPLGDFDMLVIWPMNEGVETLNYEITPDDAKWMTEMAKLTGGVDKSMAKMEEFFSYVDSWENTIARKE